MRKRQPWRVPALILLAAWLLASSAAAVDLDAPCSLTVEAGRTEFAADLAAADVVIDLYRVADAAAAGEDGCEFRPAGVFSGLALTGAAGSDDWQDMARSAAALALEQGVPVVTGAALGSAIDRTDSGAPLSAGLYLLIARGRDISDHAVTVVNDAGETVLVTVARSEAYEYVFAPQLLAMPARAQESGAAFPEGEDREPPAEADSAPDIVWVCDLAVTLKPDRLPRFGSVEITASLRTYAEGEPATFVFDVEAVLDGELLYSDVAAISFTAPGAKTVLLERVPAGTTVTVREVYSGAQYDPQTAAARSAAVTAGTAARVEFENDYNGSAAGGHGITNHFTYNGDTWAWVQRTDNAG